MNAIETEMAIENLRPIKKVLWGFWGVGLAGLLAFGALALFVGLPNEWQWWMVWPVVWVLSSAGLGLAYLKEPWRKRQALQLDLQDLMSSSLGLGAALFLFSMGGSKALLLIGLPFCFGLLGTMVWGLLSASREGVKGSYRRWGFALAFGALRLGQIALMALGAVMVTDYLAFESPFYWVGALHSGSWYGPNELIVLHRLALSCFPLGVIVMFLIRRCGWTQVKQCP